MCRIRAGSCVRVARGALLELIHAGRPANLADALQGAAEPAQVWRRRRGLGVVRRADGK